MDTIPETPEAQTRRACEYGCTLPDCRCDEAYSEGDEEISSDGDDNGSTMSSGPGSPKPKTDPPNDTITIELLSDGLKAPTPDDNGCTFGVYSPEKVEIKRNEIFVLSLGFKVGVPKACHVFFTSNPRLAKDVGVCCFQSRIDHGKSPNQSATFARAHSRRRSQATPPRRASASSTRAT